MTQEAQQNAQAETESVLTPEVKAMIGVAGELIESWGTVDVEYLRRFTQAVMDPDPRYWDEDFAKSTHYGAIIVPPIMVSYMTQRIRPDAEDAITKAFEENPMSDGIGSVRRPGEVLTPEVKAMIGVAGELIESWGTVDVEYLRRFTQAVMDPDPRYWDEDFAKSTHYGAIIVPPIMVSYMTQRIRPDAEDAITKAFEENPMSDGIGSVRRPGELPEIPTHLVRTLNAGNEIEIYQYPNIGDVIFFQNRYHDIRERVGRDGKAFLIITREITYTNQDKALLCITRQSSIRR